MYGCVVDVVRLFSRLYFYRMFIREPTKMILDWTNHKVIFKEKTYFKIFTLIQRRPRINLKEPK